MKFLDRFRKFKPSISQKRKKEESLSIPKIPTKKPEVPPMESRERAPAKIGKLLKKPEGGRASEVLLRPYLTEKASRLQSQQKVVFEVFPSANRIEIKKAVQDLYGVLVEDVDVLNLPRKNVRYGKSEGWTKARKKAVVTLKEGEKFEWMEGGKGV